MALALAVDEADFACLKRYGMFGEAGFDRYLRRTQAQLRVLRREGLEVHLRVLEPADYEDFCEEHDLDPEDTAARVAYAADPELAGDPFVYDGGALRELLPALVEDHLARVRISAGLAALLGAVEECGDPEGSLSAVLRDVSCAYHLLAAGAGDGCHLASVAVRAPSGDEELYAAAELCVEDGALHVTGRGEEAFWMTLAAARASGAAGELLLRSHAAGGASSELTVRGWWLSGGVPRPMHVAEVRRAACADERSNDPSEGPSGSLSRYLPGFDLSGTDPGVGPPCSPPP